MDGWVDGSVDGFLIIVSQISKTQSFFHSFSTALRKRTFETFEFLRKYQDDMTPVGLAFFQAEYDETVRRTFHDILSKSDRKKVWAH